MSGQRKYPDELYERALKLVQSGVAKKTAARLVGFTSFEPLKYLLNKKKVDERNNKWRMKNPEKVRSMAQEGHKEWKKKNPIKALEILNRARKKYYSNPQNKLKEIARSKVKYALKKGLLARSLCFCGSSLVEAHHPDYSKPLEVVWLCKQHHEEIHSRKSYTQPNV